MVLRVRFVCSRCSLHAPQMERPIARAPAFHCKKRDLALDALKGHVGSTATWTRPGFRFSVWVRSDESRNIAAIFEDCTARGIYLQKGSAFRVDAGDHRAGRLAFGHAEADATEAGATILGEVAGEQ